MTFRVKDKETNAEVVYNFDTREENETITVVDPDTGDDDSRAWWGGGHIVGWNPIVRSEGTGIRRQRITLSASSDIVLDMINGYNCDRAPFEWHVGLAEKDTGILVDTPACEFVGFVDTISPSYAAIDPETGEGGEAVFEITVVSLFRALTSTNPAVRSQEQGESRSGDKVFEYADSSNTWRILWGKEKSSHKDRNGSNDGKNPKPKPPVRPGT